MICSMTAFAHGELSHALGHFTCDLRSFNHRYLEISVHTSERLSAFENSVREVIRETLARGKVECKIYYQPKITDHAPAFTVNRPLVQALAQLSEEINVTLKHAAPVNAAAIWGFPGVLTPMMPDVDQLQAAILEVLHDTLDLFKATRQREGKALQDIFIDKIKMLDQALGIVKKRYPAFLEERTHRLKQRFAELQVAVDPARLEQEMVIFMQKSDVAEEIERIEVHLREMRRVLETDTIAGRRLDFLVQELNRETNTLGSKSVDATVTHQVVEMKVLLEQIREQVQNVE
jgi:uncharacterized protein (TIGR00255 family)